MSSCAPLVLRGDPRWLESLGAELEDAASGARKGRGFRSSAGTSVFLKYGPLRGKSRARHALRRALGLSELPRIQEFENLAWLRDHGFDAPPPLAAGVAGPRKLASFQFLVTQEIRSTRTLEDFFRCGGIPEQRANVLRILGRDLARLHALGFVHRDLFLRNLLMLEAAGTTRIFFLDAWRGGPRKRTGALRGPEYDVACLMLEGATTFDRAEQQLFLHSYEMESGNRGRALSRTTFFRRVEKHRRAVLAREGRRRDQVFSSSWTPPF